MSARKFSRRALLGTGVVAGTAIAATAGMGYLAVQGPSAKSNIGKLDFTNPLAIPPLAEYTEDESGGRSFELTLQTGESRIFPEGTTDTWGANGTFLAPTLRASRGQHVAVTVHNELPEDTTIHWHGMHLPPAMDGGPHQPIPTGESWSPEWTIEQPAATLWYHPHPHGNTAEHVYRGVCGLFILDDEEESSLALPRSYGIDDIPLILQDRKVTEDGDFSFDTGGIIGAFTQEQSYGLLGDRILVNGTYNPVFTAQSRLVRFRILNGSNTRFYNLGFTDDRSFSLLATDSGLVPGELPVLNRLVLSPGERVELLVEFQPGDETILRSFTSDGSRLNYRHIGGKDEFDLLKIIAGQGLQSDLVLPESVLPARNVVIPDGITTRMFEMQGHNKINDDKMDMSRVDEAVPAGATELWEVKTDGNEHNFHIHGCTFQVVEVQGNPPYAALQGPKDTVPVLPDHNVKLLVTFANHIDTEMPYMYHCHILRHEDQGIMGQFVMIEPGASLETPFELEAVHSQH